MNVEFRRSFVRDLKQIRDQQLQSRIKKVIEQLEHAHSLQEMTQVKQLQGSENYYRLRIGAYRLGLVADNDTIILVRFLHRKDIYRYFP